MPFRPGRIMLAALAFGLAVAGGYTLHAESDAYLAGPTTITRVAAWTSRAANPGLSITTQKLNLLDCENALLNPGALGLRYLDQATREAIPATCLDLADRIVATAPTHAYGWYIGALAAARLGDWAGMTEHLHQSRVTGPLELWIAQRRISLADQHRDQLDVGTTTSATADLQLMLLAPGGLAPLLRRYASHENLREDVAAAIDALPETDRQIALSHLVSALDRATAVP